MILLVAELTFALTVTNTVDTRITGTEQSIQPGLTVLIRTAFFLN
jgi:hypothetical protein